MNVYQPQDVTPVVGLVKPTAFLSGIRYWHSQLLTSFKAHVLRGMEIPGSWEKLSLGLDI